MPGRAADIAVCTSDCSIWMISKETEVLGGQGSTSCSSESQNDGCKSRCHHMGELSGPCACNRKPVVFVLCLLGGVSWRQMRGFLHFLRTRYHF